MSLYVIKLLPVLGELEIGDITFWDNCEGYYNNQFVKVDKGFLTHAQSSGWKKFKYFLCSYNLQTGDEFYHNNLNYSYPEKRYNYDPESIDISGGENFKVVGKISPEATWVKDGDKINEDDWRWITYFFDDLVILPKDRKYDQKEEPVTLQIKGCCGHFH